MESTFDVDGKTFKVEFSVFGFEKYYYDGNLLLKRWSCKFKDRLSFECGKRNVEIDVSISSKNWSIQAFIDGVISADELFPVYKNKIEHKRNQSIFSKSSTTKYLALWLVVATAFFIFFRSIN